MNNRENFRQLQGALALPILGRLDRSLRASGFVQGVVCTHFAHDCHGSAVEAHLAPCGSVVDAGMSSNQRACSGRQNSIF